MVKKPSAGTVHTIPLEKFYYVLLWFVRITLVLALYRSIISENWYVGSIVVCTLILTFLAVFIERRYTLDIPIEFEIGFIFLVYGSIFLGELRGYYATFWWWDLALHTLTGAMIGLVGFLALVVLSRRKNLNAAPGMIALFAFSLAAASGGIWEIFEFCMDQAFGLNMQKSGLVDTMGDMMVNNLGALFSSLIGYIYLKSGEVSLLNTFIQRFKKENPVIAQDVSKTRS
ncbi:hypothetical protein EXS73_03005 [Candidatus Pacearchaeota archaeon]|nr:hypothetical protein [Candidatus Pacearchaeota archaeon]